MTLKNPILLVPGVIAPAYGFLWKYWYKIPEYLSEKFGAKVYVCSIPKWGTMQYRSQFILDFVEKNLPGQDFHIIGHSKGGIDSRYILGRGYWKNRVLSLTSLVSPFKGSTVAKYIYFTHLPFFWVPLFKHFYSTLKELFPGNYDRIWNDEDKANLRMPKYYVRANIKLPLILNTYPLFWITSFILRKTEGPNDGFVSYDSAEYGELLESPDTDHVGLIGHFYGHTRGFDYFKTYENIVGKMLEAEGAHD